MSSIDHFKRSTQCSKRIEVPTSQRGSEVKGNNVVNRCMSILSVILTSVFMLSAQTQRYTGGHVDVPHPIGYYPQLHENIRQLIPDEVDINWKDSRILVGVYCRYPGIVDSVIIENSTGNRDIDGAIIKGVYDTAFYYPDTLRGYPTEQWVRIPIMLDDIRPRKGLLKRLRR